MNKKAFEPFVAQTRIPTPMMSSEERSKIRFKVDPFDDNGLYGQFPEISERSEAWTKEINDMMEKSKNVLTEIMQEPVFKKFFEAPRPLHMGWKINEVLADVKNPAKGYYIWSFNANNNRNLGLVMTTQGELIIVTHQFQYQDDHTQEFHWLLRHDACSARFFALKTDSYRLYQALTVLSDPEKARAYFRASIYSFELFS